MTLTIVVGSSGSGKTTFLNDVHKSHECTYIRQYHNLRPYIKVSQIPDFDPSGLPFWDIYKRENKAETIKVGGTIAGNYLAGLSGGQRKLLLFELIHQRTITQKNILIILDEPFAGVTDDFVPFIVDRLKALSVNNNLLIVTNDHVDTLRSMADNTITVSALDRTTIRINNKFEATNRELAIIALSQGGKYIPLRDSKRRDLQFFIDVEIKSNTFLKTTIGLIIVCFLLFLVTFWNSSTIDAVLVNVAGGTMSFVCLTPLGFTSIDWRDIMIEEGEALVHVSTHEYKMLKFLVMLILILVVSIIQYFTTNAVLNNEVTGFNIFLGMLAHNEFVTLPMTCVALFTDLSLTVALAVSSILNISLFNLSTTFTPGGGVKVVKELRYFFSRFYFWCQLPFVQLAMEGCPKTEKLNNWLTFITGQSWALVLLYIFGRNFYDKYVKVRNTLETSTRVDMSEVAQLQQMLFCNRIEMVNDMPLAKSRLSIIRRTSMIQDSVDAAEGHTGKRASLRVMLRASQIASFPELVSSDTNSLDMSMSMRKGGTRMSVP